MAWKAPKIELTSRQKTVLSGISTSRTARQDYIVRSKIILCSAEGLSNAKISEHIGIGKFAIGKWRNRWLKSKEVLLEVERNTRKSIDYKRYIEKLLSDAPRSGAPPKFTEEHSYAKYYR